MSLLPTLEEQIFRARAELRMGLAVQIDGWIAASVETLRPDGKWEPAQFVRDGGELRISRALRPLRPLVLRIKLNQ